MSSIKNDSPPKSCELDKYLMKEKSKPKFYKQKFRNCWLQTEFTPWISRNPDDPEKPYCLYCKRKLEGGVAHLRRHAKSTYHKKREEQVNIDATQAETDHIPSTSYSGQCGHSVVNQIVPPNLEKVSNEAKNIYQSSSSSQNNVTYAQLSTCSNVPPPDLNMIASNVSINDKTTDYIVGSAGDVNSDCFESEQKQELRIIEEQVIGSTTTDRSVYKPPPLTSTNFTDDSNYIIEVGIATVVTIINLRFLVLSVHTA